jgi:hypothetical protein
MSTPADNIRSYSGIDARRSVRIERAVPLVILGTDKLGQPFLEETSAVSLNLHGCRYPSRHEYSIASWVTLKVTGTEGRAHVLVVRARVCSILSPKTRGEFCQVGVEFETPQNVWGIDAPPDDCQRLSGGVRATTSSAAAVAPAREPAEDSSPLLQAQAASEVRRAEVTELPAPTPAPAMSDRAREIAPGSPERVVASSDQLITALPGKLQQAADRDIGIPTTTHLGEGVRKVQERVDKDWGTNVWQTEQYSAARIDELQIRAQRELDSYRSRAEEIAQRLEFLISSTRSNLSKMQRFVEHVTHEVEPQLNARLNESLGRASKELENVAAQVSERQFANFTQGTQAVWQEALLQLDARVAAARPLFENAQNVPSLEHIESLLHSMKEETLGCVELRLQEMRSHWEGWQELQRNRPEAVAQKVEKLAGSPVPDLSGARKLAAQAVRELEPQVYARLEESVGRAAQDFETAAACASDRQLVRFMEEKQRVAREASLEIEAGAAEARALLQKAANVTLDEFRRQVGVQFDLAISDATQRMTSSLASLDAENRAACDARRRALESDVARAGEQSTQEFRTGIKAFLFSCLVAAVSAVDEHAQSTLNGLGKNAVILPDEFMPSSDPSEKGEKSSSSDTG